MVGTGSKDSLGYETFKLIGIVAEVYSRISTKPGIFYHFIALLYTSSVLHFQPFSILHLKPVQSYTSNLFNPTLPTFSILHFQPFLSCTSNPLYPYTLPHSIYPTLPTLSILKHYQPFISLYTSNLRSILHLQPSFILHVHPHYLSYTCNFFYLFL